MDLRLLQQHRWHGGQLLAFSGLDGKTDFYQGLTARTAFDAPAIDLKYPCTGYDLKFPGTCRLLFPTPHRILLSGDFFELETIDGPVRGAFLDAHHLLVEGPCQVSVLDAAIVALPQKDRTLVGSAGHFEPVRLAADLPAAIAARGRWLKEIPLPRGLSPQSAQTLAEALAVMKTQVYTPEGRVQHRFTTPDRWPHRGMWLWDSVFHAIGWRHLDPALAREMIEAFLDVQHEDGFIPHASSPRDSSQVTQPPVLALGVKLVDEADPQPEWIARVYPRLAAYVEWDLAHRDTDGEGLAEWLIEADPNCRSGESGMDNSPRFDSANQLDAVDFNSFLALECWLLAGFARRLGREAEAGRWQGRHHRLCRLINQRLWSAAEEFYLDFDIQGGQISPVLASTGFLPLICGAATPLQAQALARHLVHPAAFATPLRVASIASKDSAHYAKDMWRGPVWINVNWLIAYGLERSGMFELAADLRAETRDEIERGFSRYGTLFEFYDDRREVEPPALLRKGRCAPEISPFHQVFHDYGWTATLYADLAWQAEKEKSALKVVEFGL